MLKMDEMEMAITLKAVRVAWFYTVVFLFVWTIVEFSQSKTMGLPFILLISQNLVFMLVQLFLKRRMA